MAGRNLPFNSMFHCFGVAHQAQKALHRHMLVNQRLGLIALKLGQIFRVALEVPMLQQRPVDLVEICQR